MNCPECGSKMKAVCTKNIPDVRAITFRYRCCPVCGWRGETAEEVIRTICKSGPVDEFMTIYGDQLESPQIQMPLFGPHMGPGDDDERVEEM